MTELVSQRAYARMRGVSVPSIAEAVRKGRIPLVQGKIDPALADATWGAARAARQDVAAQAVDSVARREAAMIQMTLAKVQMVRRQAEQLRTKLIDRDEAQQSIGKIVATMHELLPHLADDAAPNDAALLQKAVAAITDDLRDIATEALKVTVRE